METPILIHNNTHIELTRIVKFKGDIFFNKKYFFIADINNIEASRYGEDKEKCTRIEFNDGIYIKVSESYKHIRDTLKIWQKNIQELEVKQ